MDQILAWLKLITYGSKLTISMHQLQGVRNAIRKGQLGRGIEEAQVGTGRYSSIQGTRENGVKT